MQQLRNRLYSERPHNRLRWAIIVLGTVVLVLFVSIIFLLINGESNQGSLESKPLSLDTFLLPLVVIGIAINLFFEARARRAKFNDLVERFERLEKLVQDMRKTITVGVAYSDAPSAGSDLESIFDRSARSLKDEKEVS